MGQTLGANSGGVHWSIGLTNGQPLILGRRGVEWCKLWTVGPTVVVTINHQSGGWSDGVCGAGEFPCPAVVFQG